MNLMSLSFLYGSGNKVAASLARISMRRVGCRKRETPNREKLISGKATIEKGR